MKKQELHEFLIGLAQAGMEMIIADGGDFRQRAVVVDPKENLHVVVVPGPPLHGRMMAEALKQFAKMVGGADAIAVQADGRLKISGSREEFDRLPKGYSIAADPANRECLITAGRSREHHAVIISPYERTKGEGKDVIVFDEPEPTIGSFDRYQSLMIPDIWEKVN